MNVIDTLENILEERKSDSADTSYTASLYAQGDEAILKKVIEESTEVLLAAKENNKEHLIHEVADLYFHILVLLRHKNIKIDEIYTELEKRLGTSGIHEKRNRTKS